MMRLLGALILGLLLTAVGRADLLPPGTKNIPIEYKFEADKDYSEWVFFVVRGSGGVQKVAFDAKTPIVIPGSSGVGNGPISRPGEKRREIPYRASALAAIPKDAVKKYGTEKELHAAIEDGTVEGMIRVPNNFYDHENAKATDPRKSIAKQFRVTKINKDMPKEGIVLEEIKPAGGPDKPPTEESEMSSSPTTFTWIVIGFAVAAVVGFAGFWFSRHGRHDREMGT
jgi:hypothetical protein